MWIRPDVARRFCIYYKRLCVALYCKWIVSHMRGRTLPVTDCNPLRWFRAHYIYIVELSWVLPSAYDGIHPFMYVCVCLCFCQSFVCKPSILRTFSRHVMFYGCLVILCRQQNFQHRHDKLYVNCCSIWCMLLPLVWLYHLNKTNKYSDKICCPSTHFEITVFRIYSPIARKPIFKQHVHSIKRKIYIPRPYIIIPSIGPNDIQIYYNSQFKLLQYKKKIPHTSPHFHISNCLRTATMI